MPATYFYCSPSLPSRVEECWTVSSIVIHICTDLFLERKEHQSNVFLKTIDELVSSSVNDEDKLVLAISIKKRRIAAELIDSIMKTEETLKIDF
jgi:hypothetical protein